MGLHVKHEHNLFIKRVSHFNPIMTRTRLVSTHDLFIYELVVLSFQVMSDFATPMRRNELNKIGHNQIDRIRPKRTK